VNIWVDGDACPNIIKEILFRAANRTKTPTILVANQVIRIPPSPFIKMVQVAGGFDVADDYIVDNLQPNDLVITADIPLADAVITKGGAALNPRGEMYTVNNIKQRLGIRDFNDCMRGSGMMSGGPPKIGKKEIQAFGNSLDRFLTARRQP
jgi:uncharacterized protein YaiI (UPF0178 family)